MSIMFGLKKTRMTRMIANRIADSLFSGSDTVYECDSDRLSYTVSRKKRPRFFSA